MACLFLALAIFINVSCFYKIESHQIRRTNKRSFEFWDTKIRKELSLLGVEIPEEKIKRRQNVVLYLAAKLVMTNIIGSILLIVYAFGTDFGLTIAVPFSNDVLVKLVTSGIFINQSLIRFLPFGYLVVIAVFLSMTLEELNKILENLVTDNCFDITCEFRRIRLLHLNLSKMISFIDKVISYYFAFVFAFGIGLLQPLPHNKNVDEHNEFTHDYLLVDCYLGASRKYFSLGCTRKRSGRFSAL